MQELTQDAVASTTVIRPIVSILAKIVSLANDNVSVFYSEDRYVSGSAEAEARCAELDAAFGDTRTYVNKYVVTYEGTGYGNVYTYTSKQFKTQIEPLYPPVVWPPAE